LSGIVALFHLDGRFAEEGTLERLILPIRHRAVDGQKLWLEGAAGIANLHLQSTPTSWNEVQPAGCPQGTAISFDGRLDNREELIRKLPGTSAQDLQSLSDAACVLGAYREFGESFAQHLRGDFAVALLDCAKQKLLLARDIMGICPLYHCQTQRTFLAASEIKSILAYPGFQTRPDDDALADLLLGGDPYERERTCFAGISRVLPGHTIVVTPEKVRSFQHWDFDTTRQIRCASIEEYAERLRALFEQAVRRRLRSSHPVAVLVSGGLDSSAILCQAELLKSADASVAPCVGFSMTFPQGTDADEQQFLNDIEAAHKISVRKLACTELRFVDDKTALWNSELPQLAWDARSEVLHVASQTGCRIVLDGYYGDQMLANAGYMVDLARSFSWRRLQREFAEWGRWMTEVHPRVLRQELRWILSRGLVPYRLVRVVRRRMGMTEERSPAWYARPFRERAFQRYVNSQRSPRPFASHYAQTCFEFLMARPRLNTIEADNKTAANRALEKAYPFMDTDLVEFLLAIPGSVVHWKGIPKGLFRQAMKGTLPDSIRLRHWKGDFTALNNEATANDYQKFLTYLGPACSAVTIGYMDPVVLQREFPNRMFDRNNSLPATQVTAAAALELWLRAFWGEKDFTSHTASIC
jgi:asparagine synthase (glutamine-hydrolysing)